MTYIMHDFILICYDAISFNVIIMMSYTTNYDIIMTYDMIYDAMPQPHRMISDIIHDMIL